MFWIDHDVYEEIEDKGQNYISDRWAMTEKTSDGKQIAKARLVACGYEEENKDSLRTDSPTISKDNLRLLFAIIATHYWKICDLDIKGCLSTNRDIYLKPPIEAGIGKLWKLKTTVYGSVDAARSCYMTVKEELLKLGAEMSKFDEALFIWRSEEKLHGLIGCHVDDFIYGGSVLFNQ